MIVVTLTRVTTGGGGGGGSGGGAGSCSLPEPIPSLPSRLRSIGGFDQAQDASDTPGLVAFAMQAAGAVAPGLIGSRPQQPVHVQAAGQRRPDALVVPLLSTLPLQQHPVVAGLVSLLLDCTGRAYYSAVDDLTLRGATVPPSFPAVSMADAAARLGTAQPQLIYTDSPFAPQWRNPNTGETIAAFAA